jgi:AcrR family transcriptional regulator
MSAVVHLVVLMGAPGYDAGRAFRLTLYGTIAPFVTTLSTIELTMPEQPKQQPRKQRADAARNRARLLEVAYEVFAAEGLAVPIDEIARRAGVGAGTVYRHFPTKEALFRAIVADRLERFTERARTLAAGRGPGDALFAYFAALVEEGATDEGLVDALAGIGFDLATEAPDAEEQFMATLTELLAAAQRSGEVRADLDAFDMKTLLVGCQAMQRYRADPASTARMLAIVRDGLAAR